MKIMENYSTTQSSDDHCKLTGLENYQTWRCTKMIEIPKLSFKYFDHRLLSHSLFQINLVIPLEV